MSTSDVDCIHALTTGRGYDSSEATTLPVGGYVKQHTMTLQHYSLNPRTGLLGNIVE